MTQDVRDSMTDALQPVMLSALQHYMYCPRQCALIHVEQQFQDNVSTLRGNAVHALVDEPATEIEKGVRVDRALPLYSHVFGLTGKADIVEWHGETPYPVEYKHGARKEKKADEIQLAAQAMCLEEMTNKPVSEGALYHFKSRRRRIVKITDELKAEVVRIAQAVRALFAQPCLPPPVNDLRCRDCSLYEICQPKATAEKKNSAAVLHDLYSTDLEEEESG